MSFHLFLYFLANKQDFLNILKIIFYYSIQIGDYYPFECSEILETPNIKGLNSTMIENV